MRILLRYGFCHTVVLDKDSKFFGVCHEAIDLLKINCHILSSANHNPMIVKRINRYLTKGLKIMCNERDSVRVALEAMLLLLYAWNSCPVPGTDISHSLVAVGREFAFPDQFFQWKTLGAHFITEYHCLVLKGISHPPIRLPPGCRTPCPQTTLIPLRAY